MNLPARRTSLEFVLYDMLYLVYFLPTATVAAKLPPSVSPVEAGDGLTATVVWWFHVLEAKAARLPSPRVRYSQVSVYTLVRDPLSGERALYFLSSGVTSPLVHRVARWLRIPVEQISLDIRPDKDKRLDFHHYAAYGEWQGSFAVEAKQTAPRLEQLAPFANAEDAVIYLTDALVGLYGNGRALYRLEAWHPRLQPRVATVERVALPFLQKLLDLPETRVRQPDCALLAPRGHYLLHLPPRRLAWHTVSGRER